MLAKVYDWSVQIMTLILLCYGIYKECTLIIVTGGTIGVVFWLNKISFSIDEIGNYIIKKGE